MKRIVMEPEELILLRHVQENPEWINDWSKKLQAAHLLVDRAAITLPGELLLFLEKPWKWQRDLIELAQLEEKP